MVLPVVAADKKDKSFEAEFVASDVFRSGSMVLAIAHGSGFEGDYFGGRTADTGVYPAFVTQGPATLSCRTEWHGGILVHLLKKK